MKRFGILAKMFCLTMLALLSASCVDDYFNRHGERAGDKLTIEFVPQDFEIKTRAAASTSQENEVKSLYYWIFQKQGNEFKLIASTEKPQGELTPNRTSESYESHHLVASILGVDPGAEKGEMHIYAIANYTGKDTDKNSEYKTVDSKELNAEYFKGITEEDDLKELIVSLPAYEMENGKGTDNNFAQVNRPNYHLLMTGSALVDPKTTTTARVLLKRIDAKIKFVINGGDFKEKIDKDTEINYHITVHPKRWRVQNVPKYSLLFDINNDITYDQFANSKYKKYFVGKDAYYSYQYTDNTLGRLQNQKGWQDFEGEADGTGETTEGNSFTFYMFKNLQKDEARAAKLESAYEDVTGDIGKVNYNKLSDDGKLLAMYRLRERQKKNLTPTKKDVDADAEAKKINISEQFPIDGKPGYEYTPEDLYWGDGFPKNPGDQAKYSNGDFVYAPEDATYVEFIARVEKTYKQDRPGYGTGNPQEFKEYVGDVRFIVHLGNFETNDPNSPLYRKYTDFQVWNNTFYTYNIEVRGFHDIRLEVTTNNQGEGNEYEFNTGMEGHVTETSGDVRLDAHYDQGVVSVNFDNLDYAYGLHGTNTYNAVVPENYIGFKEEFQEKFTEAYNLYKAGKNDEADKILGKYVKFEVNTPYNHGMGYKRVDTDKMSEAQALTENGPKDTDWLFFVFNDWNNQNGYLEHPRRDPIPFIRWSRVDQNSEEFYKYRISSDRLGLEILKRYIQAKMEMKEENEKGSLNENTVKDILWNNHFSKFAHDMLITVYVNEFYYDENPVTAKISDRPLSIKYTDAKTLQKHEMVLTDGQWFENGWRTFVNQPDRSFKIYFNKFRTFSADGRSSLGLPAIDVSQRSIIAPYTLEELPLYYSGFGFESVDALQSLYGDVTISGKDNTLKIESFTNEYQREDMCMSKDQVNYAREQFNNSRLDFSPVTGFSLYQRLEKINWPLGGIPSRWDNYIQYHDREEVRNDKPGYRQQYNRIDVRDGYAGYTPLMCNRDLPPYDGIISEDEVKWYMPSLLEMEYIWIATASIRPDARLKTDGIPYLTSTAMSGGTHRGGSRKPFSTLVLFDARYGTTYRQTRVKPNWATYNFTSDNNPNDPNIPSYHYGFDDLTYPWNNRNLDKRRPVRVLACRKLGNPYRTTIPVQRVISKLVDDVRWEKKVNVNEANTWQRAFTDPYESEIYIDCRALPQSSLRKTPVRGPLPPHGLYSEYAYPYKAFRVARASFIRSQYEYMPRETRIYNKINKGDEIDGKPGYSPEDKPLLSRYLDETKVSNPCQMYWEEEKGVDRGTWRLPNARELELMVRHIPPTYSVDLQYHYWKATDYADMNGYYKSSRWNWDDIFYNSNDWRPINKGLIFVDGYDPMAPTSYNSAYLATSSYVNIKGAKYQFYGSEYWGKLYGFRLGQLKHVNKTRFDVRCVKDVEVTELKKHLDFKYVDQFELPYDHARAAQAERAAKERLARERAANERAAKATRNR